MSQPRYEIMPVTFPLVKILCIDDNGKEEITITEDITGWNLDSLNHACEAKFLEWVESR